MSTYPYPSSPSPQALQSWGQSLVRVLEQAQDHSIGETDDSAASEGEVQLYTAGGSVSSPRVLMTTDNIATVVHANPAVAANATRLVGISISSGVLGAAISAKWDGTITYDGFAFDLTKAIFCGTDGALVQVPPVSGFVRCVGYPILPTKMRVDFSQPIFLA